MIGEAQGRLPTTTVSPARLRMCQPTQRPTYRTGEWIVTPWGRCRVTGRFGQRHQDLLDAFLWHAEKARQIEDGGIEILVDPAKVRKTMSDVRHSLSGLQKLIRELREVTLEIETPKLMIMGGLVDHVVKSPVTRPDPMNGGERHLWRVRIGLALAELLRNDLPLHYDPTPITRLQTGISQAIVRHILSHSSQPNGGWDLDNLIRSVCGELDSTMIRHRRRELRIDAAGMEAMGIFIDGERIVRRGSKPCSTRPVLQDPSGSLQADNKHPPEGSASPPSPSAPTPRGVFFRRGGRWGGGGHASGFREPRRGVVAVAAPWGRRPRQSICASAGCLVMNVDAFGGVPFPGAWRETHRYSGRTDIARHFVPLRDGLRIPCHSATQSIGIRPLVPR